jgi:oxepin-CoA hydrolase/3-oxo-5,6-dehydrosuberyl-CoA semialdehyde dehydrogenase|tara:strand:- start:5676 stop:6125 length:450 start_codon:yes stop_codon:yes gene_type:complete
MSNKWNLENILKTLDKLSEDKKPAWGEMSAQRMVEHLSDTICIANGKNPQPLAIHEDKIEKMQGFLETDKPMARNIEVPFAGKNVKLRNEELSTAIDEFAEEWLLFEDVFESNPNHTARHSFYGDLNYRQWKLLNDKHLNHHFEQFGLI